MKTRQVTVAAGTTYTEILATIPAHELVVVEDIAPRVTVFQVQFPDDAYATTHEFPAGVAIRRQGAGMMGILGRPPGYSAYLIPATGDIYLKIRDKALTGTTVKVIESESIIYNDQI